ncbi:MAG: DUF4252 domain-containing protein [Bacteroidales bacterium]|nr:DUF4252 domain-containing protein [Bacteroidales bacterium]
MKKTILAALLLIAALLPLKAQKALNLYNKYSDEKGMSAVYISPAMFRLIGKVPSIHMDNDVDISPIIKNLNGMYILNCEDTVLAQSLRDDVDRYMNSGKYELLMEAKEDGEVTRMYTVGNDKIIKSFVLLSVEPGETSFISFEGEIPRDKLEDAIAKAAD